MSINFPKIINDKIKLNSFLIPRDVIKKMQSSIESSLFNDKEVGFNLCRNNNDLVDDMHRTGNGEIQTIRRCTKGEYVGMFHTHTGKSDLSFRDIANIYNDEIGCVGSTLDGLIYCHIRKSGVETKAKEKIVTEADRFQKKLLPDGSLRHEDKLEYDKTVKSLQDKLFKTFLIAELYEDEYE